MEAFLREHGRKNLCEGGVIDENFLALNKDELKTIGAVRKKLIASTLKREDKGRTVYYYVVDSEGKLVGVLSIMKLTLASDEDELVKVMTADPYAMDCSTTLNDAVNFLRLSTYRALPVVSDGRLLGTFSWEVLYLRLRGVPAAIERQDVEIDRLKRELSLLLGWDPGAMQLLGAWGAIRLRGPWLLVTMLAGLICAFTIHRYETLLAAFPLIAAFIPLVLALADAVCHQASSIAIVDQHEDRRSSKKVLLSLWKEFRVASGIGFAACITLVAFVLLWQWLPIPAVAVGLAVLMSVCAGGLIGQLVPSLLSRCRRDPHVSGGPIALALTDMAATLVLLEMSRLLLT